jgi:acetolactate synthase-1/2/3 large subunit
MGFSAILLDTTVDRGYVSPVDFGSIGLGLGASIGVACSPADRRTILTIGDGALLMSLGDLDTAARHQLPIIVVVMDDAAYGAELHHLAVDGEPTQHSVFARVDFESIANGMGCRAASVRSMDDLAGLEDLIALPEGPLVLDCKVDQSIRAKWFEEFYA